MHRFLGILLLLVCGAATVAAVNTILWQDRAIRSFVEVDATILSSRVATHRGKHTSYSPEVSYRYTYQGRTYDASNVLPVNENSDSRAWAQDIVNRYNPGRIPAGPERSARTAKAYINPDNPQESILIRQYSFTPYAIALVTLLIAEVGAALIFGIIAGGRTKMQAIALDDSGWQLLLPTQSVRTQFRNALACFVAITLTCTPVLGHYIHAVGSLPTGPSIITAVCAVAVLASAILTFRRWSVSHHMSDVRVRVKPVPMPFGEVFALQAEADAYAPLQVNAMHAHIICLEHYKERRGGKTYYGTRTRGEKTADLVAHTAIPAGQVLAGRGEVFFEPSGWPASWDGSIKLYPYYTWEIRIKIDLRGAVDYSAVFPLEAG